MEPNTQFARWLCGHINKRGYIVSKEHLPSETPQHPSAHQDAKEKAKQNQYPKEDKNKTARQEHTNGSTPKERL